MARFKLFPQGTLPENIEDLLPSGVELDDRIDACDFILVQAEDAADHFFASKVTDLADDNDSWIILLTKGPAQVSMNLAFVVLVIDQRDLALLYQALDSAQIRLDHAVPDNADLSRIPLCLQSGWAEI